MGEVVGLAVKKIAGTKLATAEPIKPSARLVADRLYDRKQTFV